MIDELSELIVCLNCAIENRPRVPGKRDTGARYAKFLESLENASFLLNGESVRKSCRNIENFARRTAELREALKFECEYSVFLYEKYIEVIQKFKDDLESVHGNLNQFPLSELMIWIIDECDGQRIQATGLHELRGKESLSTIERNCRLLESKGFLERPSGLRSGYTKKV